MFTLRSQLSVSAAAPAPEGIRLQPLIEVISNSCGGGENCRVKVSCQSGSVCSAHSVQSALYCKSLLINLMPLAEPHSCLKSVTRKKKSHNTLMLEIMLQHWIYCKLSGKVISLCSGGFVVDAFILTVLPIYSILQYT